MARHTVLVDQLPGETRVALLDADDRLIELVVDREQQKSLVGRVYLGRVVAVRPAFEAAFVDIGETGDGFLALAETRPHGTDGGDRIVDYVNEGDAVIVQVIRDPVEDKGPRLSMRPALAGRFLVYGPGRPGVNVSRRIEDQGERQRLRDALDGVLHDDESIVARTAADGAPDSDLIAEVTRLRGEWRALNDRAGPLTAPALLYAPSGIAENTILDWAGTGIERIVVGHAGLKVRLRTFLADAARDLAGCLKAHSGTTPLFEAFGAEAEIEAALDPIVPLPAGGSLIIAETPALTAIDVNIGRGAGSHPERLALETNLEAMDAVARELRRRNIAGLVVIDAVSMRDKANGNKVLARLKDATRDDPATPHIGGFTRFGLIELTRRRRHAPLSAVLGASVGAGLRKSATTLAFDVLRRLPAEAKAHRGSPLAIHAAPAIARALSGDAAAALAAAAEAQGRRIAVRTEVDWQPERAEIAPDEEKVEAG